MNLSILHHASLFLAGSFLFLFIYWKRLREDYSSELIFSSAISFILAILAGLLLSLFLSGAISQSSVFIPSGLWFWGCFLGFVFGYLVSVKKFKLRSVETFEGGAIAAAPWLLLAYLIAQAFLFFAVVLFLLLVFYVLEKKYKSFQWYKSGRKGFSGFATLAAYFVVRGVASILAPNTFSLIGKVDLLPSAISAFLLLFSLYNLSEES